MGKHSHVNTWSSSPGPLATQTVTLPCCSLRLTFKLNTKIMMMISTAIGTGRRPAPSWAANGPR